MPGQENSIDVSVVIPVYNEEKFIAECIGRVGQFMALKNWRWELIISNDGSSDTTARIVKELVLKRHDDKIKLAGYDDNRGKGAAVREGVKAASGRVILVSDADLSAPIKEMDKLIKALEEGYEVAIGSRAVHAKDCDVQQSFKRWFAGRIFNALVRTIVVCGFGDTQCGFKCFKKETAKNLFSAQRLEGFSFDVEILYLAQKKGLKIKEVPVMWREGKDSRIRLVRDSIRMVRELFLIRKYHK